MFKISAIDSTTRPQKPINAVIKNLKKRGVQDIKRSMGFAKKNGITQRYDSISFTVPKGLPNKGNSAIILFSREKDHRLFSYIIQNPKENNKLIYEKTIAKYGDKTEVEQMIDQAGSTRNIKLKVAIAIDKVAKKLTKNVTGTYETPYGCFSGGTQYANLTKIFDIS